MPMEWMNFVGFCNQIGILHWNGFWCWLVPSNHEQWHCTCHHRCWSHIHNRWQSNEHTDWLEVTKTAEEWLGIVTARRGTGLCSCQQMPRAYRQCDSTFLSNALPVSRRALPCLQVPTLNSLGPLIRTVILTAIVWPNESTLT
jgi:hypothetical protein